MVSDNDDQIILSKIEILKNEGNGHFKENRLPDALNSYSAAFDVANEHVNDGIENLAQLSSTVLSNRAMCYLKQADRNGDDELLQNCVKDCTSALDLLSGNRTKRTTGDESGVRSIQTKLFYRRARAHFMLNELNTAAQDCLTLLSIDKYNKSAATLLKMVRSKHEHEKVDASPLAKILAETKTNLEDLKYEALLLSLKRVYALLSDDVNTIGMELGRRKGSLSLMFDISKGIILGNSIDNRGDEKLCDDDVEDVTKCRVFALKVISTASSYAPFVRRYLVSAMFRNVMVDVVDLASSASSFIPDNLVVVCISLLLRMIIALDDISENTPPKYDSLVNNDAVIKLILGGLFSSDINTQKASLDLLSTWTSNNRDSIAHFSAGDGNSSGKKVNKVSDADMRSMTPRQLAAHNKHRYDVQLAQTARSRRNTMQFLKSNGMKFLLQCAVKSSDNVVHQRDVGVTISRLVSTLIDEGKEKDSIDAIKKLLSPILSSTCSSVVESTSYHKEGVVVEEILEESDEEDEHFNTSDENEKGQLVASLFLANGELGAWALSEGWGGGVTSLQRLIESGDARIASEIVAVAASTESGRALLGPLLTPTGGLEGLIESDDPVVRSGAASAMAKLGLASKALTKSEGEMIGMLELAVDLLYGTDDTSIERGVEVLNYLVSNTSVKEEIAHGFKASHTEATTALQRLVELSLNSKADVPNKVTGKKDTSSLPVCAYGLASIFSLLSISVEELRKEAFDGKDITAEQYEELQKLAKTEEEKEVLAQEEQRERDDPETVGARIRKMAVVNVPRGMVELANNANDSTSILEQISIGLVRMACEPSVRGNMIQQGCLSACIKIENDEIKKLKSPTYSPSSVTPEIKKMCTALMLNVRHCIAKLLVTTNPNILTSSQRMGSIRPLLQLVKDNESSDLSKFEALLSVTNISSVGDETKNRVISEKGIKILGYAMFSEHEMVRRAATEAMSNLYPHPDMIEYLKDSENLRLWVAFATDYEENFDCAKAACGCLAMATQEHNVALALTELKSYEGMVKMLLECGNLEMLHRILVIVLNMLGHGGKSKEATLKVGSVTFCGGYIQSFEGKNVERDLNMNASDQELMETTIDMAKSIVTNFG